MRNLLDKRTALLTAVAALGVASAPLWPASTPVHDEAADRAAIERLVVEYSYLLDHGRAGELAALFTPDGVFDNPNNGMVAVGREAIGAYYTKRAADPRTTRHISTNLRIVFETPDRAVGTRIILYYRGDGAGPPFPAKPGSVGEYSEVYKRGSDGRWYFASRKNTLLFSGKD